MTTTKRLIAALAIVAFSGTLTGCLHGHHAKQVMHKPMKLGADVTISQART